MDDVLISNGTSSDGKISMKGTAVSSGKIKGRACVAMNLDEAQNIRVKVYYDQTLM